MIDNDIMVIALLVLQVVLLVVHAVAQRREIGRLNRRLSTLGTEVGLLKAKRKTQKAPAEAATHIATYPGIAPDFPDAGPLDLSFLNCRSNPVNGQFLSPSWI